MIDHGDALARLRSDAVLRLGKGHLEVVRATNKMYAASFREVPFEGRLRTTEVTTFGREVGGDEIAWWVHRHAADLDPLRTETTKAHEALQVLMRHAQNLRNRYEATTYEALVEQLWRFCEQHQSEIDVFASYVEWLKSLGVLAPSILFSYRVWGSTRVSDRSFPTPDAVPETDALLLNAAAYALGLRDRFMFTVQQVELEVGAEIADSLDPEDRPEGIAISYESIRNRVTVEVLSKLVTYFEQLRHSCREILRDTEKQSVLESLLDDEAFWRTFITRVASHDSVETQYWDVKETLEIWHAGREPNVEIRFAERVAAFANADGGVFIVGVTDKPHKITGISDTENKIKHVFAVVEARTNLPSSGLRVATVDVEDDAGKAVKCLVVAVARSAHAVWVCDTQNRYAYPVRRGPGLERWSAEDVHAMKLKQPQVQDWDFLEHLRNVLRH